MRVWAGLFQTRSGAQQFIFCLLVRSHASHRVQHTRRCVQSQLLVAGALVAAGVAIVFGVRHFRGEEQPEETKNWAQRKVSTCRST